MSQFIKVNISATDPSDNTDETWLPQWRLGAIEVSDISSMRTFLRSKLTVTRITFKSQKDNVLYVRESVDDILKLIVPDKEFEIGGAL